MASEWFAVHRLYEDQCRSLDALIGPRVTKWLKNDCSEIVVSGSIVLDHMNGTSHATDIDVFCTRRTAKAIVLEALQSATVTRHLHRTYSEDSYDRFSIYTNVNEKKIDIVVCESPLLTVSRFDMTHNKVAYDGKILFVHEGYPYHGRTTVNIEAEKVGRFFADITIKVGRYQRLSPLEFRNQVLNVLNLVVNPPPLNVADMIRRGLEPNTRIDPMDAVVRFFKTKYGHKFLVTMKRMAKYAARGYHLRGIDGIDIVIPENVRLVLLDMADPVDDARLLSFKEASEMYFRPEELPDIATLSVSEKC